MINKLTYTAKNKLLLLCKYKRDLASLPDDIDMIADLAGKIVALEMKLIFELTEDMQNDEQDR